MADKVLEYMNKIITGITITYMLSYVSLISAQNDSEKKKNTESITNSNLIVQPVHKIETYNDPELEKIRQANIELDKIIEGLRKARLALEPSTLEVVIEDNIKATPEVVINNIKTLDNNTIKQMKLEQITKEAEIKYISPVDSCYNFITSDYGMRIHPTTKKRSFHHGVDLGAPKYSKAYAIADGQVIKVSYTSTRGKYVVIKFEYNDEIYYGEYFHLNKAKVKKGQKVKQGQIIATTGNTGRATGAHLHFGIKSSETNAYDSECKSHDPFNFLDKSQFAYEYDTLKIGGQ